MKKNKILLLGFAFMFILLPVFAQSAPKKVPKGKEEWRYLNQAKEAFEKKDYGTAFTLAERSKEVRRQDSSYESYVLEYAQRKIKLRKIGDKLDEVLNELKVIKQDEAYRIIMRHLDKKGKAFFKNSFAKVLDYIPYYSNYAEADYLIAQIYRVETEYEIALSYYKRAFSYCENLDVPAQKYDILYDMASLSFDMQNFDDYEKYLLMILDDNKYYKDDKFMSAVCNLITDSSGSLSKFFMLYRCDDFIGLKALIQLNDFYLKQGLTSKAFKTSALAAITAVTKIDHFYSTRDSNYEYNHFANLLRNCSKDEDVIKWGNDERIWELFYLFGKTCSENGKILFAKHLFETLKLDCPDTYWKKMAEKMLLG